MKSDVLFLAKLQEFIDYGVKAGQIKQYQPQALLDYENTDVTEQIDQMRRVITEEWDEFWEAIDEVHPLKDVAKEAADLLFTLIWMFQAFNLPIVEALTAVCENNNLKWATGTVNEVGKLIKHPDHPKVDLSYLFKDNA